MSMNSYHDLVDAIPHSGEVREDRTGTGTLSLFGEQVRWHERHSRPMGMILPKPTQLLEAFWAGALAAEDVMLLGYEAWPPIKAPVAV